MAQKAVPVVAPHLPYALLSKYGKLLIQTTVIAFFDLVGDSHIFFVVKNIGKSIATDVKLTMEPPFAPISDYSKLNELSLIKNGIAAISPGSEIRTLFVLPFPDLGKALSACPIYKAKIEYKGGLSPEKIRENSMY